MDPTLVQLLNGLNAYQARQNELLQEVADLKVELEKISQQRDEAERQVVLAKEDRVKENGHEGEGAADALRRFDDALRPTEVPSIFHNKPRPKQAEPFA